MEYLIRRATYTPRLKGEWDGAAWRGADVASVNAFCPASFDHRPVTEAKVLYDDEGIYVMFRSWDRYVRCTRTEHQSITSRDSCVEVYLKPKADRGYFNFEMNCGGAALMMYITDPTRIQPGIFIGKEFLPPAVMGTMRIYHSLPKVIPIEIAEPVEWMVEYFIPNALFERYVGPLGRPGSASGGGISLNVPMSRRIPTGRVGTRWERN